MELPELTSPDGLFTYFLTAVLAFTLVIALYIVAVYAGLAPAV